MGAIIFIETSRHFTKVLTCPQAVGDSSSARPGFVASLKNELY